MPRPIYVLARFFTALALRTRLARFFTPAEHMPQVQRDSESDS